MTWIHPEWLAHQRARFMRPDAERYMRPDAHRYMRPDAARYGWPDQTRDVGGAPLRKYRADQPRVPAGSPEGGEWTDGPLAGFRPFLAGMPRIPRQRPPDSPERVAAAKQVARLVAEKGPAVLRVIAKTSWLYPAIPYIRSYLDDPRTLDELQSDLSPKAGYDVHHIVEKSSAEQDGFPARRINDPDNLVRIPRMKHWEINAWYQTKRRIYGDMSPRDYLRGKDWDERRRIGLEALVWFGVLRP